MEEVRSHSLPIRFEGFEVDLQSGELRRQGAKVKLQEQPFQVLVMLLARPGEVVTREELQKKLWPADTFVDFDRGLNKAINRLREALGDDAESPRFIETLPRRGYRFVAPVKTAGTNPPFHHSEDSHEGARPGASLRQWWLLASAGVLLGIPLVSLGLNVGGMRDRLLSQRAQPRIESIAVLPLQNLSGDPAQEYFADGMTDELITEIAKISSLRVTSRTSVMQYKGGHKPLPVIARELGVDAIVEGTVVRSGQKVRITAQLIQARDDRHLWSEKFERDLGDVLKLQGEVAEAIAGQIQIKLTPQEHAILARARPVNPQAYEAYLKGSFFRNKPTPEGWQKAIEYFQQAIDKDPNYALAYTGLADTYNQLSFFSVFPPREVMPKAKAAALKALGIDDRLGEAHAVLGWASFTYDWDWPGAGKHFERALALNPANPTAHVSYSLYLGALGRSAEALAETKRALHLDPASPATDHIMAVQLYLARQFDQAIEQCRKTQEMDPNFPPTYWVLGHAYTAKGMYREALAEYEKYSALSRGSPESLAYVGYAHAQLGERSQALRVLEELRATSKQTYVPAVSFAVVYVGLAEKDQAFMWLEKAYVERTNFLAYLRVQATFDPLRSDPRFANLLRRIGLSP